MGFLRDMPDADPFGNVNPYGLHYSGPPIHTLKDEELIHMWFDLDKHLNTETLTQVYTELCTRHIPRIIEGPRHEEILERIFTIGTRLHVMKRICRHCKVEFVGTAAGLCSGCGKFQ